MSCCCSTTGNLSKVAQRGEVFRHLQLGVHYLGMKQKFVSIGELLQHILRGSHVEVLDVQVEGGQVEIRHCRD